VQLSNCRWRRRNWQAARLREAQLAVRIREWSETGQGEAENSGASEMAMSVVAAWWVVIIIAALIVGISLWRGRRQRGEDKNAKTKRRGRITIHPPEPPPQIIIEAGGQVPKTCHTCFKDLKDGRQIAFCSKDARHQIHEQCRGTAGNECPDCGAPLR
jgi:hypothetical protein